MAASAQVLGMYELQQVKMCFVTSSHASLVRIKNKLSIGLGGLPTYQCQARA